MFYIWSLKNIGGYCISTVMMGGLQDDFEILTSKAVWNAEIRCNQIGLLGVLCQLKEPNKLSLIPIRQRYIHLS
jgi:hypothetical protein